MKRTGSTALGDQHGQILISVAVMLVVLLGIAALAVDGGFMYDKRNRLAAAADAGAKAAAFELLRRPGASRTELTGFASHEASVAGFTPCAIDTDPCPVGMTSVTVRIAPNIPSPPVDPALRPNSDPGYVYVELSEGNSTFLSRVLGVLKLTPGAWAVAGPKQSDVCLISFGNVTVDSALTGALTADCSVAVTGTLRSTALDQIAVPAPSFIDLTPAAASACATPTPACPTQSRTGVPAPYDPLSGLSAPPGPCIPGTDWSSPTAPPAPHSAPPAGCYGNVTIDTSTLLPPGLLAGRYDVTGTLTLVGGAPLSGTDVTLYLGPTATFIGGTSSLSLSAPTDPASAYKGIALFQDRNNANPLSLNGGAAAMSGVVYAAGADLTLGGTFTGGDCLIAVSRTLRVSAGGSVHFRRSCSTLGGSPIRTAGLAQ